MDEENKKTNPTSEEPKKTSEPEVKEVPKAEEKVEAKPTEPKAEPKIEAKKDKKTAKSEKPKKKKKVGLIVSIIIILLAVIGGAIGGAVYAIVFARTEVDLSKYVTIEFDGYEGYASFDESDLIVDQKGLKKLLDDKKLASRLEEKLLDKAEVKENEGVKNGDEIEIKFKVSENWLKENKIQFTSDTIKIKVKDLEEPNTIDLFEDLEFSYSGISPDLTVSLTNNSKDDFIKNKVSFTMEKEKSTSSSYGSLYDVANGDKITVTASFSQSDLEDAGYVVAEDEYTFTVEGQAEYVIKSDSITADVKESIEAKLLSKAKSIANSSDYDVYYAYQEDFWDEANYSYNSYNFSHSDPELVKMYVAINNDLDNIGWSDSRNIVFGIYKVTFTDSTTSKNFDYFIPVYIEDVVANEDGLYTGKSYYAYEFYNSYYDSSDGKDYHRSSDEVYKAIQASETDYTITEVK